MTPNPIHERKYIMANRIIRGAGIVALGSFHIAVAFAAAPSATPPPPVQKATPVAPLPPAIAAANNLIVRTPVALTVADAVLADGDAVDLKATLRNKSSNAPLANETIEFKIDGKTAAIVKTDVSGQALVKGHKAAGDMTLGAHVMEAHYAGSDSFATATAKGNFALFASNTVLMMDQPLYLDSVLAAGDQSLIDKHIRRAGVGLGPAIRSHRNQRIGLFHPGGHDPARAVIFETAPDQADTIGEQRGGQRIARPRHQCLAIEAEIDALAAGCA